MAFAGLGYSANILQWMWTLILLLPPIVMSDRFSFIFPDPSTPRTDAITVTAAPPSPLMLLVLIVVTVLLVIFTLIVLARLPVTIARTGTRTTEKVASQLTPIVTHHKPLPAAKKKQLTIRIVKLIQLLLVIVPFGLLGFTQIIDVPLATSLVWIVGGFLAPWPLVWFSLYHYTQHRFVTLKQK